MHVKFTQELCVFKWLQRAVEKRLTALAAFLGAPWGQGKHKRWAPPIHRKAGPVSSLTVIPVCRSFTVARSDIALGSV